MNHEMHEMMDVCRTCGGSGTVELESIPTMCPECNGTGKTAQCPICGGRGDLSALSAQVGGSLLIGRDAGAICPFCGGWGVIDAALADVAMEHIPPDADMAQVAIGYLGFWSDMGLGHSADLSWLAGWALAQEFSDFEILMIRGERSERGDE